MNTIFKSEGPGPVLPCTKAWLDGELAKGLKFEHSNIMVPFQGKLRFVYDWGSYKEAQMKGGISISTAPDRHPAPKAKASGGADLTQEGKETDDE